MTLGRPLVSPGFAGCDVSADPGRRMGESGGAAADLFSKRPALLPPYTTEAFGFVPISTSSWGGSSEGGNGEQQTEGARRGTGTRQEARADAASHSSAHFVGASIVRA